MEPTALTLGVALAMGVALAATAGLRACLPLLGLSIAGHFGWAPLNHESAWLVGWPAMICLGTACILEAVADKIPFLDHGLHLVGLAIHPIAGTVAVAALLPVDDPFIRGALALVTGGVAAGTIHVTRAATRVGTTGATAGLGNTFVSLGEDFAAAAGVGLAFFSPILAAIIALAIVGGCFFALRWAIKKVMALLRERKARTAARPAAARPTREPPDEDAIPSGKGAP